MAPVSGVDVAATDGSKSDVVRAGKYFGFQDYQWSPGGTRIAIISGAPGGRFLGAAMDLVVMNADGSSVRQLADCSGGPGGKEKGRCDGLSWSPDGRRIVFSGEDSLFVVELDTGSVRQITGCAACEYTGAALNPAWSPGGSLIVFNGHGSIDVVAADGSGWRRVVAVAGAPKPAWSPDGARIAFAGNEGLNVIEADGSNLEHLVEESVVETTDAFAWSPDGSHIAYISTPNSVGGDAVLEQVWVMNADGTQKVLLYESPCCVDGWGAPAWSPDGRSIAFGVWGAELPAVYVIGADGSGLHALSGFGFGDPLWKPIG